MMRSIELCSSAFKVIYYFLYYFVYLIVIQQRIIF